MMASNISICAACGKGGISLMTCAGCQREKYCSRGKRYFLILKPNHILMHLLCTIISDTLLHKTTCIECQLSHRSMHKVHACYVQPSWAVSVLILWSQHHRTKFYSRYHLPVKKIVQFVSCLCHLVNWIAITNHAAENLFAMGVCIKK